MTREAATDVYCDYCGLPVAGVQAGPVPAGAVARPEYCCSGCRFAASVMASEVGDEQVRRTLLKLGLGIFFAMNVMVFSMALWSTEVYGPEALGTGPLGHALHEVFRYLALLFCLPVLFLLGWPLAEGAWLATCRRVITTDLLLVVGVTAAVAYSLRSVVAGAGQIYFDVACMILLFVTLGRWFEAQGKLRSNQALDAIARLLPETVHVVEGQHVVEIPRERATVGQRLRVFPGERFGVDGVILAGNGDVDEQIVTGESRPAGRHPGDAVRSGTLDLDGDFEIEITAAAGEETVSRMLELVRRSRRIRGHYQRLADRVTAGFVPAVALVAIAAACWHGRQRGVDAGILAGLAVALIACPCALGLATPMAMWVALGRAAQSHVLFRHGPAVEQLATVRALLFDKTGTLTTGDAVVHAFITQHERDHRLGLELCAALAARSNHSFSLAIQRYVRQSCEPIDSLGEMRVENIRTFPGRGLCARYVPRLAGQANSGMKHNFQPRLVAEDEKVEPVETAAEQVLLGSPRWLQEEGLTTAAELWRAIEAAGGSEAPLSCIGWAGQIRGVFVFRESLRPEARDSLDHCRRLGLRVAVATGDRRSRADHLADLLAVKVFAEQLPEDKVATLADARKRFGPVAMIGDGLNDAPALAVSDVGIALGCGADLSRESAAICLLANDLARLPWTIQLARQTVRIIRQNLFWSFSYNILGIAIAASGGLSPIFSAGAMVASSVFVVSNSLRLNRFPEPDDIAPCDVSCC